MAPPASATNRDQRTRLKMRRPDAQMHKLAARAPPRGVWCPEVLERAQCACWCLGELYKRASLRRTCSTIVEVVDTKCEHGRRRRVLYGRRNRCKECGGA